MASIAPPAASVVYQPIELPVTATDVKAPPVNGEPIGIGARVYEGCGIVARQVQARVEMLCAVQRRE